MRKAYDFCILYHEEDREWVAHIALLLKNKNVELFFDDWCLIPGKPRQEQIETAIENSKIVGVFIGKKGLGGWLNDESRLAIENRINNVNKGVIPIFLPNANRRNLPGVFRNLTPVEFKKGVDDNDALLKLIAGVIQKPPSELFNIGQEIGGIVVVEDIPRERREYSHALEQVWPGADIHQAKDEYDGLHSVELLQPNIVILDLFLGSSISHGFELLKILNERHPYVKILILSQFDSDETITRLSSYVFHGFLSKRELISFEQLIKAVKTIAAGKGYYSPGVLLVMEELQMNNNKTSPLSLDKSTQMNLYNDLGPRVKEVFDMLGRFGYKNKEIAVLLKMRVKGVERHLSNLFRKFGVENRVQLKLIWYKLHNAADSDRITG